MTGVPKSPEQLQIPVPFAPARPGVAEPCVTCGAQAGERCVSLTDGRPIRAVHWMRRRAVSRLAV